jgi:hypothetical protein
MDDDRAVTAQSSNADKNLIDYYKQLDMMIQCGLVF